ncbi:MAG: NAD(P)H-dependent oxidoreductase [Desulfocapsaceae bacterium]|nr:NAD(P)H-dependent oxidoreductase [Desulfocapsaceae bacterium]
MAKFSTYLGAWPAIGLFWLSFRFLGLEHQQAALVALCYCGIRIAWGLKSGTTTKLDFTVTGYYIFGFLLTIFDQQLASIFLVDRQMFFLFAAFCTMALLSVLIGAKPFTAAFARRRTPEALWNSKIFITINRTMSLLWAGLFLCAALFSLLPWQPLNIILPLVMIFGVGFPFNARFPQWFMERQDRCKAEQAINPIVPMISEPHQHDDIIHTVRFIPDTIKKQRAEELGPVRSALVIFGSPRGKNGFTHLALSTFLDGMRDEGVDAEIIYLHEKNIKSCLGCFSCWTKTPGQCVHQDDMTDILAKGADVDLIIFAQPLYVYSVPGIVKNFLDRGLPGLLPFLKPGTYNLTAHPAREGHDFGRRNLIFSVCGFPEKDHFSPLIDMFRYKARVKDTPIVGELLRPASESLKTLPEKNARKRAVMQALYQAGCEVVRQGYVNNATEEQIAMPLFPVVENFHTMANHFWQYRIDYNQEKKSGAVVGDLQNYLQSKPEMLFAGMVSIFDPEKAGDFTGTFQFHLTDQENGDYYLQVKDKRCLAKKGKVSHPDLLIKTPLSVWQAIANGDISGSKAMLERLYIIEGNADMLTRMQEIFS